LKKHFLHIIYLFVFIQVFSCRKPEDNTVYTISGTLIENCGGAPKANAYMEMFQNWFSGPGNSQRLYTDTDNHGRFKFEYKDQTGEPISLWYGTNSYNSTKILTSLPAKQNLELGNVYIQNKTYLYVKLNFNTSQSINDTLYYAILPSLGPKTFTGPFTSITDSVYVQKGQFQGENTFNVPNEQGRFIWGIGFSDYKQALNSIVPDVADYHVGHFTYRGCGYKDTAYINVP
jgi:hypothetical protein